MDRSTDTEVYAPTALPAPVAPEMETGAFVQRHLRRNYIAFALDGGFYGGALAFVNANTLLPAIAQSLHGPTWLVSLMPVLILCGFPIPPIFVAHYIESLRRYLPFVLGFSFVQRLPYLIAGVVLILAASRAPQWALVSVALTPLLAGVIGGMSVTAWQQLLVNCIPESRRSSVYAWRAIIASVIGLIAGYVAKVLLKHYPNPTGYGILHLCAFGVLLVSCACVSAIHEPRVVRTAGHRTPTLWENLRGCPALLASDRRFVLYLLSRSFRYGLYILTPFLIIYCQRTAGRDDSYLGQLLIVQMVGAILGNLLAGYWGDRRGSKQPLIFGTVVFIGLCVWVMFATADWQFQAISFLFGFGLNASEVGNLALGLEICPRANRSMYLSLISLLGLPAMLGAATISTVLWKSSQSITGLAVATIACLAASIVLLLPVRDPRRPGNAENGG